MAKPVCLMVMPYGRKASHAEAGSGAPPEIDFDALWHRAFAPTIQSLGYEPVRADQDTGALIINQVIERLYFADLVLAEMTIPNGNIYYEVGVRHAAREQGCVLLSADWSRQLFDIAQMRTIRYPLPEGRIVDATAQAISAAIKSPIQSLALGSSPVHASIPGYPDRVNFSAAVSIKDAMLKDGAFQGEIRLVSAVPRRDRMARAKDLVERYWKPPVTAPTFLALLRLLKDSAESADDWNWVADFFNKLPVEFGDLDEVRELDAFALSNAGKPVEAVTKLEAVIARSGPTPERLGLLGGRYKRLYTQASAPSEKLKFLNKAIDAYEQGMNIDLNQYYCSSNLPRLYRSRKLKGDEERAQAVSQLVIAAVESARDRGVDDEWLRPTLLTAAFDAGDPEKVEALLDELTTEGAESWKLDSTLSDLEMRVSQIEDKDRRDRLAAAIANMSDETSDYKRAKRIVERRSEELFTQNSQTESIVEYVQLSNTPFHQSLNWNITPRINVLLGRNGYGKTLLLRTLVSLLQYDDQNSIQTLGDGRAEILLLQGNRERSILFSDQSFKEESAVGKVPVLGIPDTRFIDRSITTLGKVDDEAMGTGDRADLSRFGAKHFVSERPYDNMIRAFLHSLCLDYYENDRSFEGEQFSLIRGVVRDLTDQVFDFDRVAREGSDQFTLYVRSEGNEDNPLPIQKSSQGTTSVIAMFGLIYNYLRSLRLEGKDVLHRGGIVVIDEVDAHLHPIWQQKIIGLLRDRFPRVQFLLTAHNPIVVAGCLEDEVSVLRKTAQRGYSLFQFPNDFIGWQSEDIYRKVFDIENVDATFTRLDALRPFKHRLREEADALAQQENRSADQERSLQTLEDDLLRIENVELSRIKRLGQD